MGKWQVSHKSDAIEAALAADPLIHQYFSGATGLPQVATRITELVLAQQPDWLPPSHPMTHLELLPLLALAAQATIVETLAAPHPEQRAMLLLTVANHVAQHVQEQADTVPLPESLALLPAQIQRLYQQWQQHLINRRQQKRNMGRH